jgi:hypothetical protein
VNYNAMRNQHAPKMARFCSSDFPYGVPVVGGNINAAPASARTFEVDWFCFAHYQVAASTCFCDSLCLNNKARCAFRPSRLQAKRIVLLRATQESQFKGYLRTISACILVWDYKHRQRRNVPKGGR